MENKELGKLEDKTDKAGAMIKVITDMKKDAVKAERARLCAAVEGMPSPEHSECSREFDICVKCQEETGYDNAIKDVLTLLDKMSDENP